MSAGNKAYNGLIILTIKGAAVYRQKQREVDKRLNALPTNFFCSAKTLRWPLVQSSMRFKTTELDVRSSRRSEYLSIELG